MAYSEVRKPAKAIKSEAQIAAIDALDALLDAEGRLSDAWPDGTPVGDQRMFTFVLDDGAAPSYEDIAGYMLKDGSELRLGGATYACMGGIAWSKSADGLVYTPAFRVEEVVETEDGSLAPLRWYNEYGILEDALPGEAEDEPLVPVHSLWRIHYSKLDRAIAASPCFANCPAAAWECIYREDRERFLEEIGSPWASLEPLKVREDYLPPWIR